MRFNLLCIFSALIFLGTDVSAARADLSANFFLKVYGAADPSERKTYDMLVTGIESGFLWANTFMKNFRHEVPMYCQPDRLTITDSLMIDMLRKGVREDPAIGRVELTMAFLAVLRRTFPCKQT